MTHTATVVPAYEPRHAAPEDPPVYLEVARDLGDPDRYGREGELYFPQHFAPEDDPYSTAYYVPAIDIGQLALGGEDVHEQALSWEPPPSEPSPPPEAPPSEPPEPTEPPVEPGHRLLSYDVERPIWETADGTYDEYAVWPNRRPAGGRRNPFARAWAAAGAAYSAWFSHPEKGRRRRAAAVVGALALVGAAGAAWLWFGHPPPDAGNRSGAAVPPPPPPPANGAEPPPPALTQNFVDTLQPQNYEGQRYEWGAAANDYGPANATPQLASMITEARAAGAAVDVWGDITSSRWGISDITVTFADGTRKSYYDTPKKWAILQYLSGQ